MRANTSLSLKSYTRVYGPYQTYRVPLAEIQSLTGLDFGELADFDPLSQSESLSPTRVPIHSESDLVL